MPNYCIHQVQSSWDNLPNDILQQIIKIAESLQIRSALNKSELEKNMLCSISLVSHHWRSVTLKSVSFLWPRGTFKIVKDISRIFSNLENLDLFKCHPDTCGPKDSVFSDLASLTKLKHLCVRHIADDDLKSLSKISNLRSLSLSGYLQLTDSGIEFLTALANLTNFEIWGRAQVTSEGLVPISKLPGIKILRLRKTRINDIALINFTNLVNLFELDLAGCKEVTGSGFSQFCILKNLSILNLSATGVNDESLENLLVVQNLKELDLSFCQMVSVWGVSKIVTASSLKILKLLRCERLSLDNMWEIRGNMKGGKIMYQRAGDATKTPVLHFSC